MTARLAERLALPAAWAAVVVLFGALEPDRFLDATTFEGIFASQAVLAVLALALIVPLTSGDYDLSVASVLTLSAVMVAVLNVEGGWPVGWSVLAALAAGVAVGAANAAIVVLLRLDSFVVTLGTGTVVAGIALWISDSQTIGGVSEGLVEAVALRELLGVPLGFWYGVLLAAAVWYLLEYTPAGRRMLFAGRGRRVARMSGVRVGRVRAGSLVAAGALAAAAGVLAAGEQGGADPTSGVSLLLPAFAAAFLGATSIVPGRFNPWGALIAVYFLATGVTGLQILGAEGFVQELFYGGALIVAVALTRLAGGRGGEGDPDER